MFLRVRVQTGYATLHENCLVDFSGCAPGKAFQALILLISAALYLFIWPHISFAPVILPSQDPSFQ